MEQGDVGAKRPDENTLPVKDSNLKYIDKLVEGGVIGDINVEVAKNSIKLETSAAMQLLDDYLEYLKYLSQHPSDPNDDRPQKARQILQEWRDNYEEELFPFLIVVQGSIIFNDPIKCDADILLFPLQSSVRKKFDNTTQFTPQQLKTLEEGYTRKKDWADFISSRFEDFDGEDAEINTVYYNYLLEEDVKDSDS